MKPEDRTFQLQIIVNGNVVTNKQSANIPFNKRVRRK